MPETTSRGKIYTQHPTLPGGGTGRRWTRTIYGVLYSFTFVLMPDGEKRWFVSRYNGYIGGPSFGCAWEVVHSIIFPAENRT